MVGAWTPAARAALDDFNASQLGIIVSWDEREHGVDLWADDTPDAWGTANVTFGPGITNLDEILAGRYRSRSGLGLGILGTKRLADRFSIDSKPTGTHVEVEVTY